jgi:hypothetical protein
MSSPPSPPYVHISVISQGRAQALVRMGTVACLEILLCNAISEGPQLCDLAIRLSVSMRT